MCKLEVPFGLDMLYAFAVEFHNPHVSSEDVWTYMYLDSFQLFMLCAYSYNEMSCTYIPPFNYCLELPMYIVHV